MKHTPTPIKSVVKDSFSNIFDDTGACIAKIYQTDIADEIVNMVNSHDELLEAAKLGLEFMESVNNGLSYRALKIKKAIQKAERK